MMEQRAIVPLQSDGMDGIMVEAVVVDPEQDVAFEAIQLGEFTDATARIAKSFADALKSIRPDKTTIKLSVTAGLESGHLVAILGKVTGSSTLEITLEWNRPKDQPSAAPNADPDDR
jgi:hypothetical protein